MNSAVTFVNAHLVLPTESVRGSLHCEGGQIQALDQGSVGTALANVVDLEGDLLLPGLVEMHTDNFERHLLPRPKTHWPVVPALLAHDAEVAAAGITTVFDAMGVGDIDHESLRGTNFGGVVACVDDCTQRHMLRAEHFLHVRCELPAPNTIELFQPFAGHPRLKLISLMDHTPGQRQWEDVDVARVYYTGKKGWSEEKFQMQLQHAMTIQDKHAIPHREHFVAFCREHGIALASHDDTTVAHVEQARAEGAVISEFPTTLLAAQTAKAFGLHTVMGAPNVVRGGSHSGNVAATELAKHQVLDMLSSDYVPSSLLSAVLRLVELQIMSLPQAVALVSRNPAQACGLMDRGEIVVGKRADLVRVRTVIMPDGSQHGVVRAVWRAGQRVM